MDVVSSSWNLARQLARRVRDRSRRSSVLAELQHRRGDDDGARPCAVWFSHPVQHLYQLQQWLAPLEHLSERRPVLVLCTRPDSALAAARSTSLPVHLTRGAGEVDAVLERYRVGLVFYVNNAQPNFAMLRTTRQRHVHLSHGESDKISMVSHQLRAYDYCFVAGAVAAERIRSTVWGIDPTRLLPVGRPQLDHLGIPQPRADRRRTVLYAPTWEGDSAEMGYGSMASHGVATVRSLLADRSYRVVVRPHPLTGSRSREHRRALTEVEELVRTAGAADPGAGHRVDRAASADRALAEAEVGICDVSAMAMDCLGLGRRLLLTEPPVAGAWRNPRGLSTWVPTLSAAESGTAAERVRTLLAEEPGAGHAGRVRELFGDTSPGAQTRRFEDAVETVLATLP